MNKASLGMRTLILITAFALLLSPSVIAQQKRGVQLSQTASQSAGKRTALVIGNGAYTSSPLKNPPNDATDMAKALSNVGFTVEHGVNLTQRQMKAMIREFGQKLKAGGQGLFYFAGHGVQLKGHNYLIPVDAEIASEADVEDQGVDANLIMGLMDEAGNGLNVVILDACRNNPFARSFRSASNGLAQVDAPTGTLVAYSTAPGKVARDGMGRNGAYTAELLKQITVPGLPIEELMKRVRARLKQLTSGEQVPWESSSLVGDFYINNTAGASSAANSSGSVAPNPLSADPVTVELAYWDSIKTSSDSEDFKNYLAKYPNGHFAEIAKNRLSNLLQPAKPAASKEAASNTSRSFKDLMVGGDGAVASANYMEADRLFNEAGLADTSNPEPYEQLGKLYWNKAFSADGSDLKKAEQAYIEAIKRGGKAVIIINRYKEDYLQVSQIIITITSSKSIFADIKGGFTYESDYKGLTAKVERVARYYSITVLYPKDSGKYFKAAGGAKLDTRELKFGFTYMTEEGVPIYAWANAVYKLPGDQGHSKMRSQALVNILDAAQRLSSQTK
jgi:hypothetical protein